LGDPIEVKIKGYNLTLRKEEAAAITIETLLSEEQAT
jgi:Fe2+ transport system protein FeoA